jgi:hypothetical protein
LPVVNQVVSAPDPLSRNASFADGPHTVQVIQAVVESARSDGAAVAVPV